MKRILGLLFAAAAAAMFLALPARADPPDRVGRISLLSGDVEFRRAYDGDAEDALTNWPVTSGNVITTGRLARAEVRIGSTAVRLNEGTELEFARLDDHSLKLRLMKGDVALRMKSAERAAEFELLTPQGRVLLNEPGQYRIESGVVGDTTSVVSFDGSARFEGVNSVLTVTRGLRLDAYGLDSQRLQTSAAQQDDFDKWSHARDRHDQSARALRFVSNEMTGYEDLDDHGEWHDSTEYGTVWYPHGLPEGWAPYRWGRWAWVEPWGWTWVDDMPWGFAPFHYGRWALVGGSWAWVPGRVVARPAYAPALVVWVGRPRWRVSSVKSGSVTDVGWFPLAPREVYYPPFRSSLEFVRKVNVTQVTNVVKITEARQPEGSKVQYRHRNVPQAVTVVAADAVAHSRPVRKEVMDVKDVRALATLPIAVGAPGVKPVPRPRRTQATTAPRPHGSAAPPASGKPVAGGEPNNADPHLGARHEAREHQVLQSAPLQPRPGDHRSATEQTRRVERATPPQGQVGERFTPKPDTRGSAPDEHRAAPDQTRLRDHPAISPRPESGVHEKAQLRPQEPGVRRAVPMGGSPTDAARRAHSPQGSEALQRPPVPAAVPERRERGAHGDDPRTPSAPAASVPSPLQIDREIPRPKHEGVRALQTEHHRQGTAAPPDPRGDPPAPPPRPAKALENAQRELHAPPAAVHGRRHDGQQGAGGRAGMHGAPAPESPNHLETRGKRRRAEGEQRGPHM